MTHRLSKSKLIAFRQCEKRLWLEIHRPDLRVEDESAAMRFEIGHRLGELARTQYLDGTLIATGRDLKLAAKLTKAKLLETPRKAIFEATFEAAGLLVQVDLLVPTKKGWHMAEVKSSTSVKDYHLADVAIQSWVARKAGLALESVSLQVIDSKWTYPGGFDYSGLLKMESVNALIAPLQKEVPKWLKAAQRVAGGSEPNVATGRHCNDPFSCAFQEYCESQVAPVEFPIAWLPNLASVKKEKFAAANKFDLRDLQADEISDMQQRVRHATINNEIYFEPLSAKEKKAFSGTRYYLDFETINPAIPLWADTRPFQQIPFQWSCHIENLEGELSHEMFLDLSGNDPSRQFAESLVHALGKKGPIIVYNAAFEKRIVRELAERFDDLTSALNKLLSRVVDLLPLTREHYYHPDMQGSWSIKSVLPTIAPQLDYSNLEGVADGAAAQMAYVEAISSSGTHSNARKIELESALRAYCARDTLAMVALASFLTQG